jgi:hypothetical protein
MLASQGDCMIMARAFHARFETHRPNGAEVKVRCPASIDSRADCVYLRPGDYKAWPSIAEGPCRKAGHRPSSLSFANGTSKKNR